MTTWIILGGTSTIARVFARMAAERGEGVILAGRDMADMEATAADCAARGAPVAEAIAAVAATRCCAKPLFAARRSSLAASKAQMSATEWIPP